MHAFMVKEYVDHENFSNNLLLMKVLQPIKTKYYEYLSRKMQGENDGEQDYLEIQRIVHEEIL